MKQFDEDRARIRREEDNLRQTHESSSDAKKSAGDTTEVQLVDTTNHLRHGDGVTHSSARAEAAKRATEARQKLKNFSASKKTPAGKLKTKMDCDKSTVVQAGFCFRNFETNSRATFFLIC